MNEHDRPSNGSGPEAGTSLLEVMIALLIMFILMIGVLQMFSLAYLQNMGAGARTEMTYKAEQFVETLRYLNALNKAGKTVANTGITFPLTVTASPTTINPVTYTYWGPGKANVATASSPYTVSYQIVDGGAIFWIVTVIITPNPKGSSQPVYLGSGISHKSLMYTAQILK